MKHRLVLLTALAVFVPVPLLYIGAAGCASGGGDNSDRVDWETFVPIEMGGLRSSSLEELEKEAGFQVVLPSYLPEGISRTFLLSSQDTTHPEPGRAFIGLQPIPDSVAPAIQIDERLRDPSDTEPTYGGSFQVTRINDTQVACSVHIVGTEELQAIGYSPSPGEPTRDPELYPTLICEWVNEDLFFLLQFAWELPEPVPEHITPEMREEAMKVVASMIEDPYIP